MKLKERLIANYYWIIAGVTIIAMIACGGIGSGLTGVVLIPVTEDLGLTRGEFSTEVTILSAVGVIVNLLSGVLFIKFGYRKLIFGCLFLSAVGYMLGSCSNGLVGLCLAAVLEGMYGVCNRSGNPRLLGEWFHRHYGTVTGIVTCTTGLGGGLFSLLFQKTEVAFGWRGAYRVAGLCYLVVALLVLLLVRDKPSDIGINPFGEGEKKKNAKRESRDHWEGFDMCELKKKPAFYMMILGTFLSSACAFMCFYVIPAHAQDCGMSPEVGATAQSLMLFGLGACKLAFGYLSDRVGAKWMTMVSLVALTASLLLLAVVNGQTTMYAAVLVYSLALPLTIMAPTLLTPALFGYRSGAKAMGIILAAAPAANMVAPRLCNALYDSYGTYVPIFRGTALASLCVILLYLIMYTLSARDRRKFKNTQNRLI